MKTVVKWFVKTFKEYIDEETALEILSLIVQSRKNKLDAQTVEGITKKLRG